MRTALIIIVALFERNAASQTIPVTVDSEGTIGKFKKPLCIGPAINRNREQKKENKWVNVCKDVAAIKGFEVARKKLNNCLKITLSWKIEEQEDGRYYQYEKTLFLDAYDKGGELYHAEASLSSSFAKITRATVIATCRALFSDFGKQRESMTYHSFLSYDMDEVSPVLNKHKFHLNIAPMIITGGNFYSYAAGVDYYYRLGHDLNLETTILNGEVGEIGRGGLEDFATGSWFLEWQWSLAREFHAFKSNLGISFRRFQSKISILRFDPEGANYSHADAYLQSVTGKVFIEQMGYFLKLVFLNKTNEFTRSGLFQGAEFYFIFSGPLFNFKKSVDHYNQEEILANNNRINFISNSGSFYLGFIFKTNLARFFTKLF